MAKGLLFALVRRGSKLNYLDDTGNNQSERERKVHYEREKSRCKADSVHETTKDKVTEENSFRHATASKESRCRRKKLFDLTLQKLSKGCKVNNRNSPACSNNSTENAFTQRDVVKSADHRSKPMLVPSVASGYFVNDHDDASKEVSSKKHENGKVMPRIVLTDHDASNSSAACKTLENRFRVLNSRCGSLPQLQVDEKRKRPASWTGESSPRLNDFTNRTRSRTTSSLEAKQSQGLWVEAMTISPSPSSLRRNLGSANSMRPQSRQLIGPDSCLERSGRAVRSLQTKDCFVKRASSWSGGDEKVVDFNARQNRKIDIFLPTM